LALLLGKVTAVLVLNTVPRHEDVLESGDRAPRILNLGTRRRWMVSFISRPLYCQAKSPRYPLDMRLGGPQGRFGRGGEEKKSLHW